MAHLTALTHAQDVFSPPHEPIEFRAVRSSSVIVIDGELDESAWSTAPEITDFIQKDPDQGEPASYPTVVRLLYDDEALYIAAICWQPGSDTRVQNLQRDFSYEQNDLFGIAIDGFLDKRNAVVFQTTPYGSQRDMEVIDSDEFNVDWDVSWDVRTRMHEDHWVAEIAIPWRNLRYPAGADQLGVVFTRNIRSHNEFTTAPAIPRMFTAYRMAYEGVLQGLAPPPPGRNLQFNPYVLAELDQPEGSSTSEFKGGGEMKWAPTPSTVLDLTVNTDFAQAEVDREVVNLDRFSVFFPERRQFFLENANIFNASVTDWIRPFFSRQIGLDQLGNPIPLDGGLRLTGRSPRGEFGVLTMQQREQGLSPKAQFAVARYSRNLSGQSRLGGMLTYRHDEAFTSTTALLNSRSNYTYTVDGLWRPNEMVTVQGMASGSYDDVTGSGAGAQLWAAYENNLVYIGLLEYFNKDYNPGVGLEILDDNYMMHSPAVTFDLRGEWLPSSIRSFQPGVSAYIFQSSDDGDLLFGYAPIRPLRLNFQNGASIDATVEPNWQRLDEAFLPAGIEIEPGSYDYTRYSLVAESDQSARFAASATIEWGDYFDGRLTTYQTSARLAPWPRLEVSADFELNQIRDLGVRAESEDTRLYGVTVRAALNPRLQLSTIYQRNTAAGRDAWNVRLSWEYRPLSYLYLVYNSNALDETDMSSRLTQKQLIAKLTYLFEI